MRREVHVRFCERLAVTFRGPTLPAFYASVEQRDNPQVRTKPVVVAWRENRSVVCVVSYLAQKFGVRIPDSAFVAATQSVTAPPCCFLRRARRSSYFRLIEYCLMWARACRTVASTGLLSCFTLPNSMAP